MQQDPFQPTLAPTAGRADDMRQHLANERTYLAWIRTSISVVGIGFVVAKFGVWLRQVLSMSSSPPPPRAGFSAPLGAAMVIIGAALAVLGAWRYRVVRRAIESGGHAPAGASVVVVTLLILAISLVVLFIVMRSAM